MSNFEETETVRVLNMLFPGKEDIFNDILGWDPIHIVSHLRFQTDQQFIDDFYNTLSNSDDEYAQKIFRKIKTDIDTIIYKYLKDNAYDTTVPDELKIELDGTKFLLSFLEGAIYTVDKRFRTVYGSKFTYLPYLFYDDIKVVVEESDDCVDIEIYQREYLVETHTLMLLEEGYPYTCPEPKLKSIEELYWSVKELEYTYCLENLKLYSIQKKLLYEKVINWNLLFEETNQTITNYLNEVSKLHDVDYLTESDLSECLPSEAYSQVLFEIIYLWYPFFDDLERSVQQEIEDDIGRIF